MEKVANSAKNAGPDNGANPFDSRDLAITRAKVSEARHLPGYFYTSHEIYEQEKQRRFMRMQWPGPDQDKVLASIERLGRIVASIN